MSQVSSVDFNNSGVAVEVAVPGHCRVPYYFSFGLLIIRSGFLPKIFGIMLIITSVGFALNILDKFLIPQFYPAASTRLAMTLGALGGIPTILWLLIKGAKVQPPSDQAS